MTETDSSTQLVLIAFALAFLIPLQLFSVLHISKCLDSTSYTSYATPSRHSLSMAVRQVLSVPVTIFLLIFSCIGHNPPLL